MESGVADTELREAIEQMHSGFDRLFAAGVSPIDVDDAIETIRAVEQLRRRAEAASAEVLASIDRAGAHVADGHSSAKTMVAHYAKISGAEAAGRARVARVCRVLPEVAGHFRAGRFGADQLRLLGRVYANPRVRDQMTESEGWFVKQHDRHRFVDFERLVRRWEKLADDDGPTPRAQVLHERRNVRLTEEFDGTWSLSGRFASTQGAELSALFEHWCQAEWLTDWNNAKADHGDDATIDHLERTGPQRRADALLQVFRDAAACPDGAVPPGFVHNIVWNHDTFEEMAARLLDPDHNSQPLDIDRYLCRTLAGIDLDPHETIASALRNRIRRVLVDAASVVVDQGQARLFTGAARTAVLLSSPTCVWIGCTVPASQCETDHLLDHSRHGRTNPGNGAPLCGRHNRWKQQGFTITRQPDGTITILRPDGTPIPPA